MNYAQEAKRTFSHYFKTAFEAGGLKWDSDNDAEIDYAVDMILAEASGRSRDDTCEED